MQALCIKVLMAEAPGHFSHTAFYKMMRKCTKGYILHMAVDTIGHICCTLYVVSILDLSWYLIE